MHKQFAGMNYVFPQTDSEEFQNEAQNVSMQFQKVRDEVMGQYGFDSLGKESAHTANSTQEEYVAKTRARCDCECKWPEKTIIIDCFGIWKLKWWRVCVTDVVQQGISRCQDWFRVKLDECMNTIQVPLINHFICIPMQFHFLCDIMRGKIYMNLVITNEFQV